MSTAVVNYNINIPEIEKYAENDGIGILVSMVKEHKLDPWNIDIIDITDKYLAHCCEMKADNLRITGRTYLFASVLLNMKSKILDGVNVLQFQDDTDDEPTYDPDGFIAEYSDEDEDYYSQTSNVQSIDDVLQRRTSVRLNRNRVVTLRDLIRQLQFYEKLDRNQSVKNAHERAKQRVTSLKRFTPDDIINLAHEEYIEECVLKLKDNLAQIFENNDKVELNELTLLGMDKISAYISLLFLTADTDYELYQEKFYSDLYVVKGAPANGTVEG